MKTSFVDFYAEHNISPVSQDITDISKHFQRRNSLFTSLGLPSLLIKNAKIIEFGPGSGHNATYTASLSPSRYHLVDGNPKGVEDTKRILSKYNIDNLKVIQSLFLDYHSEYLFDIVWAEGCIPHQKEPITILKHLSSFTKKDGIFVLSTVNSISYLSEIIRRLASFIHIDKLTSIDSQLYAIRPLLKEHLRCLKGMSRPVDDWILDSIIQPLHEGKLLSIPNVIETLQDDYNVYSTSPKFISESTPNDNGLFRTFEGEKISW